MERDEINRYIHEEILGKCPDCQEVVASPRQECIPFGSMPDYCSDESPRRLLKEVVAKIESTEDLICFLVQITGWHAYELRATAEQIATACVEAHKAQKES